MKNINMKLDECINSIINICNVAGVKYTLELSHDKLKPSIIKITRNSKSGMLRIYETPKGLTLDATAGKNKELNEEIYTEFLRINNLETVKNKSVTYNISKDKVIQIKEQIKKFAVDNNYDITEDIKSNELYRFKIKNKNTRESVTAIQFQNGTLQVVGIRYNLWEDLCYLIENEIHPPIKNIINRFINNEDENFNIYCINNIEDSRKAVISYLTEEVAQFMYPYDLDVLISAQSVLLMNLILPDYSVILSPSLRATEGYFKKVLIKLNIVRVKDLTNKWDFGNVFDSNYQLNQKFYKCLHQNSEKRKEQLNGLTELCRQMWLFRNPISHSGPKPPLIVSDLEDCKKRFMQNLNLIKESYNSILKF